MKRWRGMQTLTPALSRERERETGQAPQPSRTRERVGGAAGLSSGMPRARAAVPACKPERALQVRADAPPPISQ